MTPEWPSNVNYYVERGSWQQTPSEPPLRSEFEYGPARQRRRFTRRVTSFTASIKMSEAEFAQFEGFWSDNLGGGVSWFNMPVYLGRNGYEVKRVRFTAPFSVKDDGFSHVLVSVKMEAVGDTILDGASAYFLSEYGEGALFDLGPDLNEAVNVDYPTAMENW